MGQHSLEQRLCSQVSSDHGRQEKEEQNTTNHFLTHRIGKNLLLKQTLYLLLSMMQYIQIKHYHFDWWFLFLKIMNKAVKAYNKHSDNKRRNLEEC